MRFQSLPWCFQKTVATRLLHAGVLLLVAGGATSSLAATVGPIADQTVTAGNDHTFSVSVSGGSLNTNAQLSRGRFRPASPASCNATVMNSTGVEEVPGATIALPFNFTGGTVQWPREHSTYQVGPHCFRLRACDNLFPFTCDDEYFHVNVTQSGAIHLPIVFTHRDRVVVPNDPEPPRQKVGAWAMRMSPSTPLNELLQLESCPTGYACSPPTLPNWVSLETSPTNGLEFAFDIPSGPPGVFEFTPKVPRLDREVEGNNTFLLSNVLTTVGSVRASVTPSSDVDFYTFYAKAGETFTIRTSTSSAVSTSCASGVDTYIRLFDDNGSTQLTANDASNTNQCSRITYTPGSDQWFYLSVEEHGQNSTISNYYLWLSGTDNLTSAPFRLHAVGPEDVTPPQVVADSSLKHFPERETKNDTISTAPSIQGSGVVSGALDPANDIDRFRFVVGETSAHSFLVSSADLGCDFDAVLNVYQRQESGVLTLMESSDDVGASTCPDIPYLELGPGHYLVTLEEDGRNAPVYHYLLDHRTYAVEPEPANNSSNTAWYLNPASPGETQTNYLSSAVTDYFHVFRANAPGVFGSVGAPGDTADFYVMAPSTTVFAETSDGRGGCPGDTRLTLYRYSVANTAPADGGGSLVTVTSNDSGGPGACSRLSYTVPTAFQSHYHVIRVTRDGSGVVGPYLLRYGADDPTIPAAPDWNEPGFLGAPDFGYGDDALDLTYGSDFGMYARVFSDTGADVYSGYDQGSVGNTNCDNPINLYLFTTAELRDGDGVCREFSGERLPIETSSGWRRTHTVAGPLYTYTPTSSAIGNSVADAMFGAIKTGNAGANRSDDDNEASGDLSGVELDVESGGNTIDEAHFGMCDGIITGAPTTESTCSLSGDYYEGQYFSFPVRRHNRLTSVELRRCLSPSDTVCSQSLEGATYNPFSDEVLWTIPYTFTTSFRNAYFRIRSVGNAARGESDDVMRLRVRVRNRSSAPSGADLMMERIVELHPGSYSSVDSRANFLATQTYPFGGGVLYDPRMFYRAVYGSSSYRTRALTARDNVYVHPLFETGELGDANGPARLEIRVRNRGTATSAVTYVDAIQMPGLFNSAGNYVGPTPTGSEPTFDTAFVSSISAGSVRTVSIDLPTHELQPQAGPLPWDGGPATVVFLRIRSGATVTTQGPFVITAPPYVPNGFCFVCAIPADVSGGIAAVSPAVPVEGQTVGVSFTETYQGAWTAGQPTHRFYVGQQDPPTSVTPFTGQLLGPSSPESTKVYGGTFSFTAEKPDNATNTVPLRLLLNATGLVESNTSNNHLPTFAAPFLLEVANTPPSFVNAPTVLAATEGVPLVRTWTVTDQNAVDRPRLTVTQIAGPSMAVTSALAPCGGNNSCVTTSWTPTDAQAAASPLSASFRVCDGDPVAGGLGACVTQQVTLNVTRVNDAPVVTSAPGPSTAIEGTPYSHQVTATDEETPSSLTFAFVSRPTGMSIHPTTGVITWTPTDVHVPSSNTVRVRVRDVAPSGTSMTRFVDQTWTIAVTNTNDAPQVTALSNTTGTEGFAFAASATVTDDDVDIAGVSQPLSCLLVGGPSFLSAAIQTIGRNRVCSLTGVPDDVDTGTRSFTLRVSDGITTTNRLVSITIANQNESPSWVSAPGFQAASQGALFQLTLDASDPDLASPVANESLTFTQLSGPTATLSPAGARVGLSWTPGAADAGTAPVMTIEVRDQAGLTAVVDVRFSPVVNANDPPYFAPPPQNLAFVEDDIVQGSLSASDPDRDAGFTESLTFSIVSGAPPGLVVDAASGALSLTTPQGRADDAQVGLWTVTVRVDDDETPTAAFQEATFEVDIANINDAPVIASAAPTIATEDVAFTYAPVLNDPDFPDAHVWSTVDLPAWLSVDVDTGEVASLPGRPNNDDVGAASFTLTVTDAAGETDAQEILLSVENVNDAPSIVSTALTTAAQDSPYAYTAVAADPDLIHGDQLTYRAPTLPPWLTFNSASRLLTGVPQNADVGVHPVVLEVEDEAGEVGAQAFSITVANVNDAPILTPIGARQVDEDATLTFVTSATDPDGTLPTVSVIPGTLPAGATFDGTTFAWTPGFGTAGNYTVRFVASDGLLTDVEDVIITVGDVNRPPILAAIGAQATSENVALTFTVSASDPDATDTVTLSATATLGDVFATGATFSSGTGAFSWTPDFDAAGTYAVRFDATDGEFIVSETVTIVVANQNRAPAFNTTPPLTADEDALYAYNATAPDADGDAVTYALTTRPTGMTIEPSSGQVSWTPTNAQVGGHAVVIEASDGAGGVDTQAFTVTVNDVNDLPVFATTPVLLATEDAAYLYTAGATDVDAGDSVTLSAPQLPSWLNFSPSTGELAGMPVDADVGDHNVVIRATDTRGGITNQAFIVTVSNVNDAPVFVSPTPTGDLNGAEGTLLTFTVAATDVDGPSLSFDVLGLPLGATFDAPSGVFSWTPNFESAGTRTVTLVADDSVVQTTRDIALIVANTDRPPTISAPPTVVADENTPIGFTVTGNDPDADAVVLAMTQGPAPATFNSATGAFQWTPAFDDAGDFTLRFTATANGVVVETTTLVTVVDVNRAPVISSAPVLVGTEDVLYTTEIDATDADGDTLAFSFTAAPAGATIDASTGVVLWTPTGTQIGAQAFAISVADGRGETATQSFVVDVTEVNDAPVFTSSPALTATEDVPYVYIATATDPDDAVLTFSLVAGPASMVVAPTTGHVSFTPRNADVGSHPVELLVDDGRGGVQTQAFVLTVANVNDAPVFAASPVPTLTVLQDEQYTFAPAYSDVDVGDTLTLSIVEAPVDMVLVGQTLQWTPGNSDVGEHPIDLRVEDAAGATDRLSFILTVVNRNDAPFFTSPNLNLTVNEETPVVELVDATDPDVGDVLTFSLVQAPVGASVSSAGVLSFTPDDGDVGLNSFSIRVEDEAGAADELQVDIEVLPINDAPVLAPIGNRQVGLGETMEITLVATDVDSAPLVFTAQGLPAGASLTGNQMSWPTSVADAGASIVTFTVSDGDAEDSETVTLVVGDGGLPPALSVPNDESVNEGELLTTTVSAVDPQTSDPVVVDVAGLPAGATFVDGVFDWTPSFDDAGVVVVTFSATNGSGTTTRSWTVTVINQNRPPSLDTVALPEALEGSPYSVGLEASDPDGDPLTFTLVDGPVGMTVSETTGEIAFVPTLNDAGTALVSVRVSDGNGGLVNREWPLIVRFVDADSDLLPDTWEVAVGTDPTRNDADEDPDDDGLSHLQEYQRGSDPFVSGAPTAPTLLEPFDGARVSTATPTLRFAESTDPDNDVLTYAVQLRDAEEPGVLLFDEEVTVALGEGEWAPPTALTEGATIMWSVAATDGFGFGDSEEWQFVVDAVNSPPPAPLPLSPPDGATVAFATPTFEVAGGEDPDGDVLTYIFTLREDNSSGPVLAVSEPILAPPTGPIAFTPSQAFATGTVLSWTAQAFDPRGGESPLSPASRVTIDLVNLPPPAPTLVDPADGRLTLDAPVIRVAAVDDPEGGTVTYRFALSSDGSFSPATTTVDDGIEAIGGFAEYDASALAPDGPWSLRVTAFDGVVTSEVTEAELEVNFVDAPPTAPQLRSPADNSEVTEQPVELVAIAGFDEDGDALVHRIELMDEDAATVLESFEAETRETPEGILEVFLALPVQPQNTRVRWRVVAEQTNGVHQTESDIWAFRVANQNLRPSAPVFVEPQADETLSALTFVAFEAAIDPDGDLVTHELEIEDDVGDLVFVASNLTANADGVVEVDVTGVQGTGVMLLRARGRDTVGAGPFASQTVALVAALPPDGGPRPDAGSPLDGGVLPDGGIVDGGQGEDAGSLPDGGAPTEAPIVTDVGYTPTPAGGGCGGCQQTSPELSAFAGFLLLAALVRRRRRRR